jgi:hypothetical protein
MTPPTRFSTPAGALAHSRLAQADIRVKEALHMIMSESGDSGPWVEVVREVHSAAPQQHQFCLDEISRQGLTAAIAASRRALFRLVKG